MSDFCQPPCAFLSIPHGLFVNSYRCYRAGIQNIWGHSIAMLEALGEGLGIDGIVAYVPTRKSFLSIWEIDKKLGRRYPSIANLSFVNRI